MSGNKLQMSERVEMTSGNNKIEVSAVNLKGVEALRVPVYAECAVQVRGGFVLRRFGRVALRGRILNLAYAHKDVLDMGAFLGHYQPHFNKIHRLQMIDENVTRDALGAVRRFLKEARVDDTIIFLVTGHGGTT